MVPVARIWPSCHLHFSNSAGWRQPVRGLRAGSSVQKIPESKLYMGEAASTLWLAWSIVAGSAGFTAVRQKLPFDHALQSAAVALASGLLNSNRDCLKGLATNGTMLRVSEYDAALMEAASPEELVGADWLGFWSGDVRTAAEQASAGAIGGASTCTAKRIACHPAGSCITSTSNGTAGASEPPSVPFR
jgi:hypothetical protein